MNQKVPLQPQFLSTRNAATIYGVHPDYFRKNEELRRERIVLTKRTHLYPVSVLDAHFNRRKSG